MVTASDAFIILANHIRHAALSPRELSAEKKTMEELVVYYGVPPVEAMILLEKGKEIWEKNVRLTRKYFPTQFPNKKEQ